MFVRFEQFIKAPNWDLMTVVYFTLHNSETWKIIHPHPLTTFYNYIKHGPQV